MVRPVAGTGTPANQSPYSTAHTRVRRRESLAKTCYAAHLDRVGERDFERKRVRTELLGRARPF